MLGIPVATVRCCSAGCSYIIIIILSDIVVLSVPILSDIAVSMPLSGEAGHRKYCHIHD